MEGREVRIKRRGNAIVLEPIPDTWAWLDGLPRPLDEDFVEAAREHVMRHISQGWHRIGALVATVRDRWNRRRHVAERSIEVQTDVDLPQVASLDERGLGTRCPALEQQPQDVSNGEAKGSGAGRTERVLRSP